MSVEAQVRPTHPMLDTPAFPGDEPCPIWRGMSAFEDGEIDAPAAGVIMVDPFCDYLGKRCIKILEDAGFAVVQASSLTDSGARYYYHCEG